MRFTNPWRAAPGRGAALPSRPAPARLCPPMRLAVLADLHANLEALTTVLAEIDRRGVDACLGLGDVVGYGPDPEAVVDLVNERFAATVQGNHDAAVATGEGIAHLPPDGQEAARQHRDWIGDERAAWLAALPLVAEVHGVTLAHAAPLEPERWPRLATFSSVQAQFDAFATDVCFIGHSHRPAVASDHLGVTRVRPGHRFLINVGSVGQPRDGDPRAAFGLFDTETMQYELVRCHYDLARTQTRILSRGLPAGLGERLAQGV